METQAGIPPTQMKGMAMKGFNMGRSAKMNPQTKMKIYYALITSLLFALVGALGYFVNTIAPQLIFNISLIIIGVLGFLHFFLFNKWNLYNEENKFSSTLLFSLLLLLLGLLTFSLSFYFLSKKSAYISVMPITCLSFMVALWVNRSFDLALNIPPYDYKKWFFPAKPIVLDFDTIDTSNIAIITYVFSKKHNDPEISNFQTKAPYELKLGDLFYGFLQEWNHRNPQSTIEFMDEQKLPFGWLFYIKEAWYKPKRYLDPDKTIKDNNIKVNQIIITQRIKTITE